MIANKIISTWNIPDSTVNLKNIKFMTFLSICGLNTSKV